MYLEFWLYFARIRTTAEPTAHELYLSLMMWYSLMRSQRLNAFHSV